MDFASCWNRVKQSTELKKQTQLAELLKISNSNISEAKVKDRFPLAWAFKIGQAYHIYTDWILTGKGPMKADDAVRVPVKQETAVSQALQFILENGNTYQRGAVKGYLNEVVEEISSLSKQTKK